MGTTSYKLRNSIDLLRKIAIQLGFFEVGNLSIGELETIIQERIEKLLKCEEILERIDD